MKFFTTLLLFISLSTFAQSKTGTIDIDYILTQMPEFTGVQSSVEEYGATLDSDLQLKIDQHKSLMEVYRPAEATMAAELKKEKQNEILELEREIANFKNNGLKLIQINREEKLRPLYQKIGKALEIVAKAQNYTLIMQINESMVYIDPATDVTRGVLTQLGIEIKEN